MTRLRLVAAALLAVFYVLPARSQAVLPERGRDGGLRENVYGLGLAAGAASGIGLSFRHHQLFTGWRDQYRRPHKDRQFSASYRGR